MSNNLNRRNDFSNFSVLMSIYAKDDPEQLLAAVNSIFGQTVMPAELVLLEDGPVGSGLERVVDEIAANCPISFVRVVFPENRGLGPALRDGVENCSHDLIARMDADDICVPDRFEKQLQAFAEDPGLDIVGGIIAEFEVNPKMCTGIRDVPKSMREIVHTLPWKNPFNHVTVMYRKSAVLAAGNYTGAPSMEDYLLWYAMIANKSRGKNLSDVLVCVRTGSGMIGRRRGISYAKQYAAGKFMAYRKGYLGLFPLLITVIGRGLVALVPSGGVAYVYKKFMRKPV